MQNSSLNKDTRYIDMYDGIVNVYKEQGFTSHDVVAKMRGIYGQKKIGHTGTLDPMAEGVLIVVLGRATKLSDMITSNRKKYTAVARLGFRTTTDDITGEIQEELVESELERIVSSGDFDQRLSENVYSFLGKSMQVPPIYSAIKVNGKKLYEYAREGIDIEIEPRAIEIYSLDIKSIDKDKKEFSFEVECSKGTYIRSLIRDIGEKLGIHATMSGLIRDEVNGIYSDTSYRLSELQSMKESGELEKSVLPMDQLLKDVPEVRVREEGKKLLQNGNRLPMDMVEYFEDESIIKDCSYFRVYEGSQLKALYTYDRSNNNLKVYKML